MEDVIGTKVPGEIDVMALIGEMFEEDKALFPDEVIAHLVMGILADGDEDSQAFSAQILGLGSAGPVFDDPGLRGELVAALKKAASAADPSVRAAAVEALSEVAGRRSEEKEGLLPFLAGLLSDPQPGIAENAASGIATLGWWSSACAGDVRQTLLDNLADYRPKLTAWCLCALSQQRRVPEVRAAIFRFADSSLEAGRIVRAAGYRRSGKPKR